MGLMGGSANPNWIFMHLLCAMGCPGDFVDLGWVLSCICSLSQDIWADLTLLSMSHSLSGKTGMFPWWRRKSKRENRSVQGLLRSRFRTCSQSFPPYSIGQSKLQGSPESRDGLETSPPDRKNCITDRRTVHTHITKSVDTGKAYGWGHF